MMRTPIIIPALFMITLPAICQTEKLVVPSDLKQQTVVTEPVTLRKGYLRAGSLLDYRVADRFFNSSGTREYYNTSSWGSSAAFGFTLQYGISDRLEVSAFTEYMNKLQESQTSQISVKTNTAEIITTEQKGAGIGDSHLELRYQVIKEKESKFSLVSALQVTLPTGEKNPRNIKSENQYDLPVGDGTYALGMDLSARKVLYPYSFSAYTSFNHNFDGKRIFNPITRASVKFRLGNSFESGLGCNLHVNEWIVFGNEIKFYHEGQGQINDTPSDLMPASWVVSWEPGLIFQVHRFRIGESVRTPLKGHSTPADPLYLMLFQYIF
jgi:hypothetical protein